jgi:acyl dehydratase
MISSSIVGRVAGQSEVVATLRRVQAYAAVLGATKECYTNDMTSGVVAPPPFAVCLEWPVVSGWWDEFGGFSSPEEALGSVHVLQDSRFHALIKQGQLLRTTGKIAAVRNTRAGAYVAVKLETVDALSGRPMVSSWWGGIFLNTSVEGDDRCEENPPPLRPDAEVAAGFAQIEIPIAPLYPHLYSECSQIWNPIHTEKSFARQNRLDDIILHGSATWALTAQKLIDYYADGDPARLARIAVRFKAPVIPGSPITIEHKTDSPGTREVAFAVRNAAGHLALTHGIAEFR